LKTDRVNKVGFIEGTVKFCRAFAINSRTLEHGIN